jgi:hypothetical protein
MSAALHWCLTSAGLKKHLFVGLYLVIAGLANNWYKELLVPGTFVARHNGGTVAERIHFSA